jgi:hypothetical protein
LSVHGGFADSLIPGINPRAVCSSVLLCICHVIYTILCAGSRSSSSIDRAASGRCSNFHLPRKPVSCSGEWCRAPVINMVRYVDATSYGRLLRVSAASLSAPSTCRTRPPAGSCARPPYLWTWTAMSSARCRLCPPRCAVHATAISTWLSSIDSAQTQRMERNTFFLRNSR